MADNRPAFAATHAVHLAPEKGAVVLSDGSPWPEDAIEVGKVVDAWGIKGGIKVAPFSSDPQALFSTKRWFVQPAATSGGVVRPPSTRHSTKTSLANAPAPLAMPRMLKVKTAKEQGDVVVATVDEVDDRNTAESLKGARVFVSRASFPTPDEDEYYWIDLIGLDVVNLQGHALGRVVGLLETGPHCVLRCEYAQAGSAQSGSDGDAVAERLIPFVAAYIHRVSLSERLIEADWGLDY